ncbi:MAG: hypothetical protein KFF49_05190 [Bacteroidales bacterium]|nr:hypothetical protein [Bacteroidales bacterium]
MDFRVFSFVFLFACLLGCNRKNNIDLEGNWYFISNDSMYFEMYVLEDSTLRFHAFDEPSSGIHYYHISNDSLKYFDYRYKIVPIDTNYILLNNNDYSISIRRLYTPYDYNEPEFHQGFMLRACYFMVQNKYWDPVIAYDTISFYSENRLNPDLLIKTGK